MLLDRFIDSLFHPLRSLDGFRDGGLAAESAPRSLWSLFAFIAVAGTLLYGASLHLLIDFHGFTEPALKLTLAAGAGWLLFGPILSALSRQNLWIVAHVCLITMVYGEAVLEIGLFTNLALWHWFGDTFTEDDAIKLNIAIVALSNSVMAVAVCAQMKRLGFPILQTALLWIVVLNGACLGAWLLLRLLP